MGNLFTSLVYKGDFENWAILLDWLFDDNRFAQEKGWTSGYVSSFTKKVKRQLEIKDSNYAYGAARNIPFPSARPAEKTIMHSGGDGEGRDIIRHIRNGIAHGCTALSTQDRKLFIEICDYKDDKKKKQTAYLFVPVECLFIIHKIYTDMEKSFSNSKKKRTWKTCLRAS